MSWFTISPHQCLDEAFDAPDAEADYELCCAIAAGKAGLHPDGWGNHDPLPLRWLLRRRRDEPQAYVAPVDRAADPAWEAEWEARHRQRPVKKPQRRWPAWSPSDNRPQHVPEPRRGGEVELTCDECGRGFAETMFYGYDKRDRAVAAIRRRANKYGWTCIVGRDRCPACSEIAPPQAIGHGAGAGQGDEQHADGC